MSRPPGPAPTKYQLQVLTEKHKEYLRRVALGEKIGDIAKSLGTTRETVGATKNCDLGRAYLKEIELKRNESVQNIANQLKALCPTAVEVLELALRGELEASGKDYLRLKAALEVLDRSGFAKRMKIESKVAHGYITMEELKGIRERSMESPKFRKAIEASHSEIE